ncbi:MAG: YggS family pyridoxal phosphate-dependent enzyme [Burkholderiales bacterium]|nr:YggS family pyridoxal phosphate-dependent enzyme [Anaerolineae bacterium]
MTTLITIADNLKRVQAQIADACAHANREASAVTLVAVSKTHPPNEVLEALAAGAQHLGENRVEESSTKIPVVNAQAGTPPTWHMIGHLQSRKAKDVPPLFQVVHSVDSLKLAEKLSRQVLEDGGMLDILLEMNVSGEEAKHGFAAANWRSDSAVREALWSEISAITTLPGLNVRGLMTMAPIVERPDQARPVFVALSELRSALAESLSVALPDLSMGMTDDYAVAIEEGATIVRIGRAIFGERNVN